MGFPEITLLEPLAQALEVSLVELMQSQKTEAPTLSPGEADAAVAGALELAQREKTSIYRSPLWWGSYLGICTVMLYFIGTLTWYVDQLWVRSLGVYLTICCASLAMTAVRRYISRRGHPDLPPISRREWVGLIAAFLGGLFLIFSFPVRRRFGAFPCDVCRILGFTLLGLGTFLPLKRG